MSEYTEVQLKQRTVVEFLTVQNVASIDIHRKTTALCMAEHEWTEASAEDCYVQPDTELMHVEYAR